MMFLKVNQEQSEIIVLIFRLSVANYGNFTPGLVTKYGVRIAFVALACGGEVSQ